MTRVLVTGANGLVGSTLTPWLRARGHTVVTCSRRNADFPADLTDPEQAAAALDGAAPEVIVNLAANTSVDNCERDPHAAYLENVRIVENLADWMRARGCGTHLVQLSSDQVYDGLGPHREESVTLRNTYAFSKYAGELAALRTTSTILRTNMFGRSRCAGRASLSDWLINALRRGERIRVFEDVRFSPLSLQRLAELVERVIVQRHPGRFNMGAADSMTKADFAFALAESLGLPTGGLERAPAAAGGLSARRPSDMSMDSTRFATAFGVTLPTVMDEIAYARGDYT